MSNKIVTIQSLFDFISHLSSINQKTFKEHCMAHPNHLPQSIIRRLFKNALKITETAGIWVGPALVLMGYGAKLSATFPFELWMLLGGLLFILGVTAKATLITLFPEDKEADSNQNEEGN
jgi:hypothetical protein